MDYSKEHLDLGERLRNCAVTPKTWYIVEFKGASIPLDPLNLNRGYFSIDSHDGYISIAQGFIHAKLYSSLESAEDQVRLFNRMCGCFIPRSKFKILKFEMNEFEHAR